MDLLSKHDRLAKKVPAALSVLLEIKEDRTKVRVQKRNGSDFIIKMAGRTFVVQVKTTPAGSNIATAARAVRSSAKKDGHNAIPLVAVPFMGEVGQKICKEAGVSWLDLSGNAHIIASGIRIIVRGNPNRFQSAGRPASLFSPKSSRVIRWLLIHLNEPYTQRKIARSVNVDEGLVSRIVSRLEAIGYVVRGKDSSIRVRDPSLLLEDWREAYQFSRHTIYAGHIAARSGEELVHSISKTASSRHLEYAMTGLGAAWLFSKFAGFRLVSLYLTSEPSSDLLEEFAFREGVRGANVWLVVPNDLGVFQGDVEKDGVRCVNPLQAYLDLKGHPERAAEAAERLRADYLDWSRGG